MNKQNILFDFIAIAILLLCTFLFFGEMVSGKELIQGDIIQYKGMASEVNDIRETENGREIHWTNSMFGGMPTYLMNDGLYKKNNLVHAINHGIRTILPSASGIFFIALVCFYIMARSFRANQWLSTIGAFAFGAGTFVLVSLVAGHNSKINAYAYAPLVLAGIVLLFRKKTPWAGMLCLAFGLGAQLSANHLQITFYTFFIALFFFISEVVLAAKSGKDFIKPALLAIIAVLVGVGLNFNKLATIYQHSAYTIRGGNSVLQEEWQKSSGLGYEQATAWSYSPDETMTLLIPYFKGGSGSEKLPNSKFSQDRQVPQQLKENVPTYWGKLPFTAGPVYIGVIMVALFCVLLFSKSRHKWWLLASALFMIVLGWGKYSPIYEVFYSSFPFFNKFRTPMMSLLMLSLIVPLGFVLSYKEIIENKIDEKKALIGVAIPVVLIVLFGLVGSFVYNYSAPIDSQLAQAGFPKRLIGVLQGDRASILRADAIRSLVLIVSMVGAFFVWKKGKLQAKWIVPILGVLAFFDLFSVGKRYISADNFETKEQHERRFRPSDADKQILQDKGTYRVLNLGSDPFSEATTSLHHKSIGGYHAAKLQPIQDVYETYASKDLELLMKLGNLLNVKYVMFPTEQGINVQTNEEAFGNAWFVNSVQPASSEKEELQALEKIGNSVAVTSTKLPSLTNLNADLAQIKLVSYDPEKMVYEAINHAETNQFAVFSELFYQQKDGDGWHVKIDDNEVPMYKVNFLLRGIEIPKGKHTIEFFYQKNAFESRSIFSLICSIIIVGLFSLFVYTEANPKELNPKA